MTPAGRAPRARAPRHQQDRGARGPAADRTYGFRGEALPAIASVSQLRLRTRAARRAPRASSCASRAGAVRHAGAVGAPEGTRVEVADLFAGVPARRKFLKTATHRVGSRRRLAGARALALPEVHFDVQRDDRPALAWPAAASRSTASRRCSARGGRGGPGPRSSTGRGAARCAGFVSRPDRHRPTAAGVYLFVNRRPVRDRVLQHALLEALPRRAAARSLPGGGALPRAAARGGRRERAPGEVGGALRRSAGAAPAGAPRRRRRDRDPALARAARRRRAAGAAPRPPRAKRARAGRRLALRRARARRPAPPELVRDAAASAARAAALRRAAAARQLLATYLVVEGEEGLLLVDQHAAHERVLYERLRAGWRERESRASCCSSRSRSRSRPGRSRGSRSGPAPPLRFGFEIEPFGADAVVVRAVPALLAGRDPGGAGARPADELAATPRGAGRRTRASAEAADRLFASLACHAARRKGEVLAPREQRALLDALDAIPWAPTCPHGRPVAVPFDLAEIERRFGRR